MSLPDEIDPTSQKTKCLQIEKESIYGHFTYSEAADLKSQKTGEIHLKD